MSKAIALINSQNMFLSTARYQTYPPSILNPLWTKIAEFATSRVQLSGLEVCLKFELLVVAKRVNFASEMKNYLLAPRFPSRPLFPNRAIANNRDVGLNQRFVARLKFVRFQEYAASYVPGRRFPLRIKELMRTILPTRVIGGNVRPSKRGKV